MEKLKIIMSEYILTGIISISKYLYITYRYIRTEICCYELLYRYKQQSFYIVELTLNEKQ